MIHKQEALFYKHGSSDKEYHIELEEDKGQWSVNVRYGRRGQANTTDQPVAPCPYKWRAEAVYDKKVKEKKAKGYVALATQVPFQQTTLHGQPAQPSGALPWLLNEINYEDVQHYIDSDEWILQPKADGKRHMIEKKAGHIKGINRRGLYVATLPEVESAAQMLPGEWLLDAELLSGGVAIFDILEYKSNDLRGSKYEDRLLVLEALFKNYLSTIITRLPTFYTTKDKQDFFNKAGAAGEEGVVFKRRDAKYIVGRPNSGGTALKYKFWATASVVVNALNTNVRSVGVRSYEGTPLGNVTIPPNHDVPLSGDIIEVRYLYAYPNGSLYQPIYLGVRDDIDEEDCTIDQLKYKVTP